MFPVYAANGLVNVSAVTPKFIGSAVVSNHADPAFIVPSVTNVTIPEVTAILLLASVLLIQVPVDPVPTTDTV